MKPEELKIIAEGMGYEVISYNTLLRVIKHGKSTIPFEYRPDTTNDTQCMEIMERLLREGRRFDIQIEEGEYILYYYAAPDSSFGQKGKTINEAICKAALEYFNKL